MSEKNQQLATSTQTSKSWDLIPESKKYEQNYIIYRMNLEPIMITSSMRNQVIKLLDMGTKHIVLGDHVVMMSGITSIDPLPREHKSLSEKLAERKA